MCTSGALKMNFPKRTLKSEKFQIDFASGFAGQPFLCRIPLKNRLKMKLLSWMLDSGFGGNFLQKQAWHHLSRPKFDSLSQNIPLESAWTRKFEWNSAKDHVGHILSVALKWCQMPGIGQTTISENDLHYILEHFFCEILSLAFAAFWRNFFIPFPAKYIPILREAF